MPPKVQDVQKGIETLIKPSGGGGVAIGVIGAPFARGAVQGFMPGWFDPADDSTKGARNALLGVQGIAGGMMAAGKLGRGATTRAIGLGVGVEALRTGIARLTGGAV